MQIRMPRRLARLNTAVFNPIQGQYAWVLLPWAVVIHRGRKTGRRYRTPVLAFKRGRTLSIGILYGLEESYWVQNVLAGGGEVVRGGRTFTLVDPRVEDAADAPGISPLGRAYGRMSGKVLVAELGEESDGFGRGPAAD